MKRKIFTVWVCAVMIASGFAMVEWAIGGVGGEDFTGDGVLYTAHAPIRIDSNADFPGIASSGNGTQANPWIIEGWDINGAGYGYCIYIGNATDYFVIRNCVLYNASGPYDWDFFGNAGVHFYDVTNGKVVNNTAWLNRNNFHILYSNYNVIINNTGNHSTSYGLLMKNSHNNTVTNNNFSNNTVDGGGVYLHLCNNNTFTENDISDNDFGIRLDNSDNNLLYHNNYINNQYFHAYDDGDNSWDNGYPPGGNYWDDYGGTDIYSGSGQTQPGNDGLGDVPYIGIEFSEGNGWFNATEYPNYAPSGIPDFDQRQRPWQTINAGPDGANQSTCLGDDVLVSGVPGANGICIAPGPNHVIDSTLGGDDTLEYAYCGSSAAADALWWLDSKYANHSGTPGDGLDEHDLVLNFGPGDDHLPANAPLLIEDLAERFDTHRQGDTDPARMIFGLNQLLVDKGLDLHYTVTNRSWPMFEQVDGDLTNCSAVILFLGFYDSDGAREGGHIVTVHGTERGAMYIGFSDPIRNIMNSIPNYLAYNDAINVSHDVYGILPGSPHPVIPPESFSIDGYRTAHFTVVENEVIISSNVLVYGFDPQDNYPLMEPWGPESTSSFSIPIHTGWNLVSIPLIQANTSVESVLSSIAGKWDVAKYYHGVTKTWKTYRVGSSVNTFWDIDHTMGFWLHTTENTTLTVEGQMPDSTGINLYAGWNMVGYPSATARLASDALPPEADIISIYQAESPYVCDYSDLSLVNMSAGNGYWVRVTSDCTWTVACSVQPIHEMSSEAATPSGTKGGGAADTEEYLSPPQNHGADVESFDAYILPEPGRASSGLLPLYAMAMLLACICLAIRKRRKY